MGFGIINFVFAIPAIWTIDTFGRRNLLLATFPFLALFQLMTGLSFLARGKALEVLLIVSTCECAHMREYHQVPDLLVQTYSV